MFGARGSFKERHKFLAAKLNPTVCGSCQVTAKRWVHLVGMVCHSQYRSLIQGEGPRGFPGASFPRLPAGAEFSMSPQGQLEFLSGQGSWITAFEVTVPCQSNTKLSSLTFWCMYLRESC